MIYNILIRPLARKLDPIKANKIALEYFKILGKIPGMRFLSRLLHNNKPGVYSREVSGISFYNPLGLGAGLDVNGELYNDLNDLGFSYTEIGPLNASTVKKAIRNIQTDRPDDVLAVCLDGDYIFSFNMLYDFCDFFVLDFSGNENADYSKILKPLLEIRLSNDTYRPIVVKIPEVLEGDAFDSLLDYCLINGIDGIMARNLYQIRHIREFSADRLAIVANCHTRTSEQALELLRAGASLIEIRSGLVLQGPSLVRKILRELTNENRKQNGLSA